MENLMEENNIYVADSIDFMPQLIDNSIDLIFADPPFNLKKDYGVYKDDLSTEEYYNWCEEWISLGFSKLNETGSFYVYINPKHLGHIQIIMEKYGIYRNTIVWHYTNPTPIRNHYPKTYSTFLFFTKTKKYIFNKDAIRVKTFQNNTKIKTKIKETRLYDVWSDIPKLTGGYLAQKEVILKPGTKQREFVYQLPEELLRRIILTSSDKNSLIFDPFTHSGTTAVICKRYNRRFLGCEINPKYTELATKRVAAISHSLEKGENK